MKGKCMKKFLVGLFVIIAYVVSFGTVNTVIPGDSTNAINTPSNIKIVKLGTCNSGKYDTLAAIGGAPHVHGPFAMCVDRTRPAFVGFKIQHGESAWDSGDTLKFEYQTISSSKLADTISMAWKTIHATARVTDTIPYIDISKYPGQSIVFKITNIDQTAALIQNPIRVIFVETSTESVDTKH
jgi:hypothetical protein